MNNASYLTTFFSFFVLGLLAQLLRPSSTKYFLPYFLRSAWPPVLRTAVTIRVLIGF